MSRDAQGPPVFSRIGIVGLGLIGGSIALAVRARWPAARVTGLDRADVLETAKQRQVIDAAADGLGGLADADLVILAAPVQQNLEILEQLGSHVRSPAVVTDTGSTKRAIVEAGRGLPAHLTFVGGHPLGGAAASGLEHARPDLFRGRPWLFTPDGAPTGDTLSRLLAFACALEAEPRVLEAAAHDRLLAFLSHLPQLTASALMTVVGRAVDGAGLALAGPGLFDTTRLASSPAEIWSDITATNVDEIGPALDALIDALGTIRNDLGKGDDLRRIFAEAGQWRQLLIKPRPV
jgi:prephenate dehydrogenase